ncbi:MAG: glycosyltransferase family 4 protein [Candidatus Binataceae bacterium]
MQTRSVAVSPKPAACDDSVAPIRVGISSAQHFWTFDLARQMERLGCLTHLYTGYPKWKVDGALRDKARTFPWVMATYEAAARLGMHELHRKLQLFAASSFDDWTARSLEPCDVFHCVSLFGLKSYRAARDRYGALTVCDRGCSHILFQDQILAEEYARWRVPYRPINPRVVERELGEYEICDLIAVPSEFARRTFVEKGVPEKKLVKLPFGVELKLFRPAPKQDRVFRVIYVGNITLRKGLQYLLEAIAAPGMPALELWLIGSIDPDVRPLLAKYQDRFQHLGTIARPELYKYYSQGSVFVMASVEEGFGMVQAQAMACGIPVIATRNTGAEDLFSDGVEGFIVPIRSPEAIREKIVYLYENPAERERMAEAAKGRVRNLGGWDRYGEAAAAAYRERLAAIRRGPLAIDGAFQSAERLAS